jgi:hypothetical protein
MRVKPGKGHGRVILGELQSDGLYSEVNGKKNSKTPPVGYVFSSESLTCAPPA